MEESLIWLIIAAAILVFGIMAFRYILPGVYWLFSLIGLVVFTVLDQVFSASLVPHCPWLMWILWGGILGGALGFWTVAPAYGLREKRHLIALAPFALMVLVALARIIVAS